MKQIKINKNSNTLNGRFSISNKRAEELINYVDSQLEEGLDSDDIISLINDKVRNNKELVFLVYVYGKASGQYIGEELGKAEGALSVIHFFSKCLIFVWVITLALSLYLRDWAGAGFAVFNILLMALSINRGFINRLIDAVSKLWK